MMRFIPGLTGAAAAYLCLPLFSWLDFLSLRFLAFLAVYSGITYTVEMALKRYGK